MCDSRVMRHDGVVGRSADSGEVHDAGAALEQLERRLIPGQVGLVEHEGRAVCREEIRENVGDWSRIYADDSVVLGERGEDDPSSD